MANLRSKTVGECLFKLRLLSVRVPNGMLLWVGVSVWKLGLS